MTSIEKKLLIAIALFLAISVGSCVFLANTLDDALTDCKGLQGVVDNVWTGEPCDEDSP